MPQTHSNPYPYPCVTYDYRAKYKYSNIFIVYEPNILLAIIVCTFAGVYQSIDRAGVVLPCPIRCLHNLLENINNLFIDKMSKYLFAITEIKNKFVNAEMVGDLN